MSNAPSKACMLGVSGFARLLRLAGLCAMSRRRLISTTRRYPEARPASDPVQRHFVADAPNRRWLADATYVSRAEGLPYLAMVLDVFSHRIVG
ncbi:hypothetical protein [Paraburkholderia sp. MM6662-R1]|uniref:hypothetical protein n=1 Tax=Paraburkholderia sp. MM6662-R1 TaxID=2991066 RepID=UPI003D23AEDE